MQTSRPVTKPAKQRKMLFRAPTHVRAKLVAAPLSPELKTAHGAKSLPVRSGDTVRIVRGDRKGFEGKVTRVDRQRYRIYVEGLTREKVDGTAIFLPVHPSKAVITHLALDDKWRKKILERKKEARKKIEAIEKPAKKAAKVKEEIAAEKVVEEEKPEVRKPKERKKRAARKRLTRKAEKEEVKTKQEKPQTKKTKTRKRTRKKAEGEA